MQGRTNRREIGNQGERLASRYLQEHDYDIVEQNWQVRSGEIDIIARKEDTLVFVEVRTRRYQGHFGTAKESVNIRKQNKIRRTAEVYLLNKKDRDLSIRFDVIAVEYESGRFCIEHIKGAF